MKKEEQQSLKQEKRETALEEALGVDALARGSALRRFKELEEEQPAKAEQVKDELFKMAREGMFKGGNPINDAGLKQLIDALSQTAESARATIERNRNRRRFGGESDSGDDSDGDL